MGIVMMAMFILAVGVLLLGIKLVTRQLPPASTPDQDRRLAEQAEEIELLRDEVRRLQDQADFTERLLSERSDVHPGDGPERDAPG